MLNFTFQCCCHTHAPNGEFFLGSSPAKHLSNGIYHDLPPIVNYELFWLCAYALEEILFLPNS